MRDEVQAVAGRECGMRCRQESVMVDTTHVDMNNNKRLALTHGIG